MLENTKLGKLSVSRVLRSGAAAALMAASIATSAGPVAASTASSIKMSVSSQVLLIHQKQAAADAAMRLAGVGPSLAGNSAQR